MSSPALYSARRATVQDLTDRLIAAREEVSRAQQAANEATRVAKADYLAVVAEARAEGLSLAQLAAILGVTRARAQQLVNEAKVGKILDKFGRDELG